MITSRKYLFLLLFSVILALVGFFIKNENKQNELVIYSSRKENLMEGLLEKFTKETGVKIKYVEDEAAQLISRMKSESKNPSADVFLTSDAVNLISAKEVGILKKVNSEYLTSRVPNKFKDNHGFWYGLTKRARLFVYNKKLVDPKSLSTYLDLGEKKWRKSILVRSSNSPYNQSLIAFMISIHGESVTANWISDLVQNMARKPSGGDTDQIYAVAAGEGKVGIVNSYYLGRIMHSDNPKDVEAAKVLGVFFPDQDTEGTMINISGGGVVNGAKHPENAVKLLEFLVSDEVQSLYAAINYEYPVVENIPIPESLRDFGNFKESDLPLSELQKHFKDAATIAQENGWS